MTNLDALDRRFGNAVRAIVARTPAGPRAAGWAAQGLSPAAHLLVAAMIARRVTRQAGVEALVGAAAASTIARVARDAIGRERPGDRPDGGLPSRHAAAAAAIAAAVGRRHPLLGLAIWPAAAVGLTGRVATAEHDPADILTGAAVGIGVDRLVRRVLG